MRTEGPKRLYHDQSWTLEALKRQTFWDSSLKSDNKDLTGFKRYRSSGSLNPQLKFIIENVYDCTPPVSGALLQPPSQLQGSRAGHSETPGVFGVWLKSGDADAKTQKLRYFYRVLGNTIPCSQILLDFLLPLSGMKLLWCITNMIISSFQNAEFPSRLYPANMQVHRHIYFVYLCIYNSLISQNCFFTHHINTWIGPPDFHTPLIGDVPTGPLRPRPANGPSLQQLQLLPPRVKTSRWDPETTPPNLEPQWKGPIPFL